MKLSEVTASDLKDYCHVEHDEEEVLFSAILSGVKQFIYSQTGMTAEECDEKEDLVLVLLLVGAEMYENRTYISSGSKEPQVNPAADAILSQYCLHIMG